MALGNPWRAYTVMWRPLESGFLVSLAISEIEKAILIKWKLRKQLLFFALLFVRFGKASKSG